MCNEKWGRLAGDRIHGGGVFGILALLSARSS